MMFQAMGRSLGVLVDRTLKCHPDLAGESIKYSWGCAKKYYQYATTGGKKKKRKVHG
jgi:hypothetical protein